MIKFGRTERSATRFRTFLIGPLKKIKKILALIKKSSVL